MSAASRQKPPRALVLQVRSLAYGVQCLFLGNKIFEEPASYLGDNDSDMIWSVDFLDNRAPTAEVQSTRARMPAQCDVQYLRPGANENPLMIVHTSDSGHETVIPGPWCVLMTANSLIVMALVIQSFFVNFMGINQPLRDNGFFFSGNPKAKFIGRKNRHPQTNKTWTTNYTIRLQYVGEITPDARDFIMTTQARFPFMTWDGAWAFDGTNGATN